VKNPKRPKDLHMRKQHAALTAVFVSSALVLAGCAGGGGGGGEEGDPLTIWTIEDVADRVTAQQALMDQFTEETGIEVELVPVAEDQLTTVLTSAAASNDLPDAIGAVPISSVYQFATDDLLDTDAAAAVVEELGADTFSERSLELTTSDGAQLSVPSDGWAQLLYYRTDLFEAAGLEAPTSFEAIEAAAAALDSDSVAGITLATAPGCHDHSRCMPCSCLSAVAALGALQGKRQTYGCAQLGASQCPPVGAHPAHQHPCPTTPGPQDHDLLK
jgi:multiple sugar transport system substrate-binding protein